MAESRYFYHSFPRPRPGEPRNEVISRGLSILKSINKSGLTLAPEIVEWHVPPGLSIGVASPLRVFQQRICFTELSPDELADHSETFGPFAMEFDIAALRRAGALPVIYMPQALSEDDHLALIGLFVVSDLKQIKDLLQILDRLQSASATENHSVMRLDNGDDERGVLHSYSVSREMVHDFMRFITFERAPFSEMIGIASIAQSLFYPTDNRHTNTTLAYYRQREWRITAGYNVNGEPRGRELNDKEKQTLLANDADFWMKEIYDGEKTYRRIDRAASLSRPGPKELTGMLHRLIVPADTLEEVQRVFPDLVVVGI